MVFYGVLDVLAKPVYCFIHVLAIEKLDYSRLGWVRSPPKLVERNNRSDFLSSYFADLQQAI